MLVLLTYKFSKGINQMKAKEVKEFLVPNAWDKLPASEQKLLEKRNAEYLDFMAACKTERATIAYLDKLATKAGFKALAPLGKGKKLKPGSRVMFFNKNRAMALAIIGKRPIEQGFRMVAAHLDVPRIDIKAQPLYEKHSLALFKTHYYGGIKKYQWAAIPLSLHIFAIDNQGKTHSFVIGEKPGDPVFTITDVAPHVAQKVQITSRKPDEIIRGEELNIIVGHRPMEIAKKADKADKSEKPEAPNRVKRAVLAHLEKEYNLTEEDLAWAEIRAVPAIKPTEVGFDRSMIGAYGHDDRACVYAAFQAIMEIDTPEHTACALFLDKEEIGSTGPNGAQSDLVIDLIAQLAEATCGDSSYSTIRRATQETQVLSADTNAPMDPTFDSVNDPMNAGYLGKGVWVTKHSGRAGKSGSSEADIEFMAKIRKMLTKEKIPYQFGEMGKVDEGGGGTVAYMLANNNMHVIDMCLPTLSLHSPFEVISKVDYHYSVSCYKAFMKNSYE
jgi:aspartyl aminopeptidase